MNASKTLLCALALGRPLAEAEGVAVPQGALARVTGGRLEVLAPGEAGLPARPQGVTPFATGG